MACDRCHQEMTAVGGAGADKPGVAETGDPVVAVIIAGDVQRFLMPEERCRLRA